MVAWHCWTSYETAVNGAPGYRVLVYHISRMPCPVGAGQIAHAEPMLTAVRRNTPLAVCRAGQRDEAPGTGHHIVHLDGIADRPDSGIAGL